MALDHSTAINSFQILSWNKAAKNHGSEACFGLECVQGTWPEPHYYFVDCSYTTLIPNSVGIRTREQSLAPLPFKQLFPRREPRTAIRLGSGAEGKEGRKGLEPVGAAGSLLPAERSLRLSSHAIVLSPCTSAALSVQITTLLLSVCVVVAKRASHVAASREMEGEAKAAGDSPSLPLGRRRRTCLVSAPFANLAGGRHRRVIQTNEAPIFGDRYRAELKA